MSIEKGKFVDEIDIFLSLLNLPFQVKDNITKMNHKGTTNK